MRSLERAIDVLEVLDNSRHPLRLAEVARRSGLHISTAQRILNVLEVRGRVERDETGYRPGVGMLFGAHAYLQTSPLVSSSLPSLQDLATATGLTASVSVRSGFSRAVVSKVDGVHPARYVAPTGERLPLTHGAGKLLAAYLAPDELDQLITHTRTFDRATGQAVTPQEFIEELASIRAVGYCWSQDGRLVGMASVAAGVFDQDGRCLACVQVAASTQELPEDRVPEVAAEVRQAASAISARFGGVVPGGVR